MKIDVYNESVFMTDLDGYNKDTFFCDGERILNGEGFRMYEESLSREIYDNSGKPFDMKKLSKEEREKIIPLIKKGGREQDYLFLMWDEEFPEEHHE